MNRGLLLRVATAVVWTLSTFIAFGVFEGGLDALDEQETLIFLAGLVVIFALDVWGWVKRDGRR